MKAVILDLDEALIENRRRLGLDARDEVWEGVYHIVPPPTNVHQQVVGDLFAIFRAYLSSHTLGVIRIGIGVRDVRSPEQNYRVPEWFALRATRAGLLKDDSSYVDEGPDVVLEVRSPGDETDAKLSFYEKVGVGEVLIVDRDTRRPEVFRRAGGRLLPVSPSSDGWLYCEGLKAFFRTGEKDARPILRVLLELDRTEHTV